MGEYPDVQMENKTLIINNKNDLLQFITMRQMFPLLQYFLIKKLDMEKVYEVTNGMTVKIGKDTVKLTFFPDEIEAYRSSFQWAVLSHFTTNIFEGVKRYCLKTNQFNKMKQQKWFLYFKTVRHSFSHDCRWAFRDVPQNKFPIKYRESVLDYDLNDKPISSKQYSLTTFWALSRDTYDFVKNELK